MSAEGLRIAIEEKGRVADACISLLKQAGLKIRRSEKDALLQKVENFPIDILCVRDDDVAAFVDDGACDLGIVGMNVLAEDGFAEEGGNINIVSSLGFGRCSLKIAVPNGWDYQGASALSGERIATSYPRLLKKFLDERGVTAQIIEMSGSVEVAPRLHIAAAICDLVSTGATLDANGLKPVETVLDSEAVLVQSTKRLSPELEEVASKLIGRIESVVATDGAKYIMLNAPRDAVARITELLPGAGSPTVVPLADESKVAVHAVCQESVFWETLEDLKAAGASAILVLPIDKMMM